jgi:hypothetical protein
VELEAGETSGYGVSRRVERSTKPVRCAVLVGSATARMRTSPEYCGSKEMLTSQMKVGPIVDRRLGNDEKVVHFGTR